MTLDSSAGALSFLSGREFRQANLKPCEVLAPRGLILGHGDRPLEVVVYDSSMQPRRDLLRSLWKARWDGRAIPLPVVVRYPQRVALRLPGCSRRIINAKLVELHA